MAKFIEFKAANAALVTVNIDQIVRIVARNTSQTGINTVNNDAGVLVDDTYENVIKAINEANK